MKEEDFNHNNCKGCPDVKTNWEKAEFEHKRCWHYRKALLMACNDDTAKMIEILNKTE
jgi:hypothetical protein